MVSQCIYAGSVVPNVQFHSGFTFQVLTVYRYDILQTQAIYTASHKRSCFSAKEGYFYFTSDFENNDIR